MAPKSEFALTWTQNLTRSVLVLFTCIVAVRAPYFGSVLGTVGGLTDALQAFVLPALICRKHLDGNISLTGSVFLSVVFVWGVCVMVYTCTNLFGNAFIVIQ